MRDSHHDQEDVGQQGVLEQGVDEAVDVRPAAGNDLVVVLEVKRNHIIEGPITKAHLQSDSSSGREWDFSYEGPEFKSLKQFGFLLVFPTAHKTCKSGNMGLDTGTEKYLVN